MVIGIQKGLENVKKELSDRGYNTVYQHEYLYHIDAYIYSSERAEGILNNLAVTDRLEQYTNINKNNGVLMINVLNKTIDEIERILKRRCFGSLIYDSVK